MTRNPVAWVLFAVLLVGFAAPVVWPDLNWGRVAWWVLCVQVTIGLWRAEAGESDDGGKP